MRRVLFDPLQAAADSTFLAVILFGLYENVNCESWDRVPFWAAHVRGAATLLKLRGIKQFSQERGGLLYIQLHSQILSICMQKHMPVPCELLETTVAFEACMMKRDWGRQKAASPASITEIAFRLVNLQAAVHSGDITDISTIYQRAVDIEKDLKHWRRCIPPDWEYIAVSTSSEHHENLMVAQTHDYPNIWITEIWNGWRILRILTNRLLHRTMSCDASNDARAEVLVIRELSTDVCRSVSCFKDSPRVASLIEPFYIVAREPLNTTKVRSFAVDQLYHINASLGIRQAHLLAKNVSIEQLTSHGITRREDDQQPSRSSAACFLAGFRHPEYARQNHHLPVENATMEDSVEMPSSARTATLLSNFQTVTQQILKLSASQPVRLVLVSKLKPASDILALHQSASDDSSTPPEHFGENYVQELQDKAKQLPRSIKWHFIGGLQSNKCKSLAESIPNLWCVSSVDTVKKADLLNKGRAALLAEDTEKGDTIRDDERQLRIMVQVNTSGEESKSGVTSEEAVNLCKHVRDNCNDLKLSGLMTIGAIARSQAAGEGAENEDFKCLLETKEKVAKELDISVDDLELSMGMSADFEGAILAGSNEVRIGSTIFGERPPRKQTDPNAIGQ